MTRLLLQCPKCEKVQIVDYYSDVYRCPVCGSYMREIAEMEVEEK